MNSQRRATADLFAAGGRRVERRGLDFFRPTKPQRALLSEVAKIALWRDGNQMGKSKWLAFEAITAARGVCPIRGKLGRPKDVILYGYSWEQMEPLMAKLWELAPKNELDPKCGFDPGRGITGKPPRLTFGAGPGKGRKINLATYKQGSRRLAGPTVGFVGLDEPPPEGVYGEVIPRVMRLRGDIRIAFTPVPDMPDMTYLKDLVESGAVIEHNYHLKAENCLPEGFPTPWLFQGEIDKYEAQLLEAERGMRMRGDWDPVFTGAMLKAFGAESVLPGRPPPGSYLIVGLDHGAQANKQTAILAAVEDRHGDRPRVWVMDETVADGITTPEQDAKAILAMLKRRGLSYDDVDAWVGDRPTGSVKYRIAKSNADLRKELARELRRDLESRDFRPGVKKIADVTKWKNSMFETMRFLNTLLHRKDMIVHPRCVQFRKACEQFNGNPHHKLKDILDAGRYAIQTAILGKKRPTAIARARY